MGSADPNVFAFQAVLVPYGPFVDSPAVPVVRTIAAREDQTLDQLHEAIRLAFGWADPHMYAFWMSGTWWDQDAVQRPDRPFRAWIAQVGYLLPCPLGRPARSRAL